MPKHSRESTMEEKGRIRNKRNKRKQLLRVEKQMLAKEIIQQKEKAAYSRAREMVDHFYGKWKQLA